MSTRYYHGTKASLKKGDQITPGFQSNFGSRKNANFVYFSETTEAAIWGAELAIGDQSGRVYIVEPTGDFEDDPNLTDKKFPGNPTKSYRSKFPLLVIGELINWKGHTEEQLSAMRSSIQRLKDQGIDAIDE